MHADFQSETRMSVDVEDPLADRVFAVVQEPADTSNLSGHAAHPHFHVELFVDTIKGAMMG